MLPRIFLRRDWAALLGAVLLITTGQSPAQDRAEERDWYDVEVVIFRQHDSGNVQSDEHWPSNPEPAVFERYARLSAESADDVENIDALEEADEPVFQQLPEDEWGLRDSARRLRNSNAYEVLLHTAWRQPGFPGTEAPAIQLPLNAPALLQIPAMDELPMETGFAPPLSQLPPGLSGYVRLIRERYLHFEADLRLVPDERSDQDEAMRGSIPLFGEDARPVVIMQERRRMRSGELHYLDNPRLGIMVQTRVAER